MYDLKRIIFTASEQICVSFFVQVRNANKNDGPMAMTQDRNGDDQTVTECHRQSQTVTYSYRQSHSHRQSEIIRDSHTQSQTVTE